MNPPPKVFISYSWDSEAHKERVLDLANRLRAEGIDCQLDQYEVSPPQGWARWMTEQIEQADYVLAICTETYKRRATGQEEPDQGLGVTWEGMLLRDYIYQNRALNTKSIPVLFSLDDKTHIPAFLGTVSFYVLDTGYEQLYRHLTDQPETVKPELGKLTPLPPKSKASPPDPAKSPPEQAKASPLDIPHPKDPIPSDSPFYVQRGFVESTCYDAIIRPGALIHIEAPRQMGKTALTRCSNYELIIY
jgi:TIR domain/AAA-like domain